VAGTFVLSDTMVKAFDELYTGLTSGTDVVVKAEAAYEADIATTGGQVRPLDESIVAKVRQAGVEQGVRSADGRHRSPLPQWSDVMWAVATRMDASRDLMTLDRTPIDSLDFASPLEGLGGKIGFDATRKIGSETSREWGKELKMSPQIVETVSERWSEFFPQPVRVGQK